RLLDAYPGVIAGTKDSAGDPARIERVCREYGDRLAVFTGSERYLLDTPRWGGGGRLPAPGDALAPPTPGGRCPLPAGPGARAARRRGAPSAGRGRLAGRPPAPPGPRERAAAPPGGGGRPPPPPAAGPAGRRGGARPARAPPRRCGPPYGLVVDSVNVSVLP